MDSLYITHSALRRAGCLVCAFSLLLSGTLFAALRYYDRRTSEELDERIDSIEAQYSAPVFFRRPLYTVGIYGGMIAVRNAVTGELIRLLDVRCETLPESDKALLGDGISVYSDAELSAIIADYTG